MAAGFTAENAEFMLQGHRIELACVQHSSRIDIVLNVIVLDLYAYGRRVVVRVPLVRHRDDTGLDIRPEVRNRVFQISGKGRDAAPSRERVADECQAFD
jgi:hypothetical protein